MASLSHSRHMKDPIHDFIPITQSMSQFIDTRQFQRLRRIKQLGTSYYVWPGSSHNRFEHCIGVAHLARCLVTELQTKQPELGITDRDVECVTLAGLCHDLGHGPWSHVWDSMFMPRAIPDRKWTHEEGSETMLDFLISDNGINIPGDDVLFIKALIAGKQEKCSSSEKPFLFDVVSNSRNGLDVDKFDYICRDVHMIGDAGNITLKRLIKSARVIDNQICYDIKDANQVYEVCAKRFMLHKMIYNHKTAKAIEHMIIDALLKAEPHLRIAERVFDAEKFIHLTDNLMATIQASEDPELAESQAIFRRIDNRELYKCVDYKSLEWSLYRLFKTEITEQKIVDAVKRLPPEKLDSPTSPHPLSLDESAKERIKQLQAELCIDHVIVDFAEMHYGMKTENPMNFVRFYSKHHPNHSLEAYKGDYSTIMPQVFAEVLLRVYTREPEFYGIIQAGYRKLLEEVKERHDHSPVPADNPSTSAPTPPFTDAPSTPRAKSHSRNQSFSFIQNTSDTPFSQNEFTKVPPSYAPPETPLRGNRREASRPPNSRITSGSGLEDTKVKLKGSELEKIVEEPAHKESEGDGTKNAGKDCDREKEKKKRGGKNEMEHKPSSGSARVAKRDRDDDKERQGNLEEEKPEKRRRMSTRTRSKA